MEEIPKENPASDIDDIGNLQMKSGGGKSEFEYAVSNMVRKLEALAKKLQSAGDSEIRIAQAHGTLRSIRDIRTAKGEALQSCAEEIREAINELEME